MNANSQGIAGKRVYVFHSVHELLFDQVIGRLMSDYGLESACGFVWSKSQQRLLSRNEDRYSPLFVFTRDVLTRVPSSPDIDYLTGVEEDLQLPLNTMIFAERHLLKGRSYSEVLCLTEAILRVVDEALDEARPDFILTEDVSCLTSYIHWALARRKGIPFYSIGSGKLPNRVAIYSNQMQRWDRTDALFTESRREPALAEQREGARAYIRSFREKPEQPTVGMKNLAALPVLSKKDLGRWLFAMSWYFEDSGNPTVYSPVALALSRLRRLYNRMRSRAFFRRPAEHERYLFYPIHYQPEASTLVRGLYFLNQVALIEDIAKSLPPGIQLYVKEHPINIGRRPPEFYRSIQAIYNTRLLGPEEDAWDLIKRSEGVIVISSTAGWEGILFNKPVITFGEVFYNTYPGVTQIGHLPRNKWRTAIAEVIRSYQPDEELLVDYVAAILATTYGGMRANPRTNPQVLAPENVANLADAVARALSLDVPLARSAAS